MKLEKFWSQTFICFFFQHAGKIKYFIWHVIWIAINLCNAGFKKNYLKSHFFHVFLRTSIGRIWNVECKVLLRTFGSHLSSLKVSWLIQTVSMIMKCWNQRLGFSWPFLCIWWSGSRQIVGFSRLINLWYVWLVSQWCVGFRLLESVQVWKRWIAISHL